MNPSRTFLWAAFALTPLTLGIELPSFGLDSKLVLGALGVAAAFAGVYQARWEKDGATTSIRGVLGLSFLAYVFRFIAPWSSEVRWLAPISFAAGLAAPIGYFLVARSGIEIARSRSDRSLERDWRGCLWIGLPILLLPYLFYLAWWVVAHFVDGLHFESHNVLAIISVNLVLLLPTVLLLHALFATQKASTTTSRRVIQFSLRVLAHPATAAAIALLFLTPSLMLVPPAIHFALTPNFNKFLAENRSAFSFPPPARIQVIERHAGLLYASDPWVDIDMEDRNTRAQRLGFHFLLELTRPDAALLNATISLETKVEPATYEDFLGLRVASEIKALDPRFRLAVTVFVDRRTDLRESDRRALPTLKFLVQVALLAGAGDTTAETIFVDGLESVPLVPAVMSTGALSYAWQSRGSLQLVDFCRGEECLLPRVRFRQEQRFDLATEEYSYRTKATVVMTGVTRGPGAQSEFTVKDSTEENSKETSWNDAAW